MLIKEDNLVQIYSGSGWIGVKFLINGVQYGDVWKGDEAREIARHVLEEDDDAN